MRSSATPPTPTHSSSKPDQELPVGVQASVAGHRRAGAVGPDQELASEPLAQQPGRAVREVLAAGKRLVPADLHPVTGRLPRPPGQQIGGLGGEEVVARALEVHPVERGRVQPDAVDLAGQAARYCPGVGRLLDQDAGRGYPVTGLGLSLQDRGLDPALGRGSRAGEAGEPGPDHDQLPASVAHGRSSLAPWQREDRAGVGRNRGDSKAHGAVASENHKDTKGTKECLRVATL